MLHIRIKKILTSAVLLCSIAVLIAAVPVGKNGVQITEAIPVTVVADASLAGTLTPIKSAISAAQNIQQTYFQSWLVFKERVLDPMVWRLINTMLANMLNSLTEWVNNGLDGNPRFITDLEGFLIDAADEAAGEFLGDEGLDLLCSPFQLDVKFALQLQYQQSKKTFEAQCTLSQITGNVDNFLNGTFSEGGWAGWFELTQGPTNDPNKAFLEGRARMKINVERARDREFRRAETNKFFLDVEICDDVEDPATGKKKCETTTLGSFLENQVNDTVNSQRGRFVIAKEFDELLTAIQQAIFKKLVSGFSQVTQPGSGSSSDKSFLQDYTREVSQTAIGAGTDEISIGITTQEKYIVILGQLISMIDGVENNLEQARSSYPSCFNVKMSGELTNARDDALNELSNAEATIAIFAILQQEFDNAQTVEAQLAVMEEYKTLEANGFAAVEIDITQTELDIQYILPDKISKLQKQITKKENKCAQQGGGTTGNGAGSEALIESFETTQVGYDPLIGDNAEQITFVSDNENIIDVSSKFIGGTCEGQIALVQSEAINNTNEKGFALYTDFSGDSKLVDISIDETPSSLTLSGDAINQLLNRNRLPSVIHTHPLTSIEKLIGMGVTQKPPSTRDLSSMCESTKFGLDKYVVDPSGIWSYGMNDGTKAICPSTNTDFYILDQLGVLMNVTNQSARRGYLTSILINLIGEEDSYSKDNIDPSVAQKYFQSLLDKLKAGNEADYTQEFNSYQNKAGVTIKRVDTAEFCSMVDSSSGA